jgi:hypothetical protein
VHVLDPFDVSDACIGADADTLLIIPLVGKVSVRLLELIPIDTAPEPSTTDALVTIDEDNCKLTSVPLSDTDNTEGFDEVIVIGAGVSVSSLLAMVTPNNAGFVDVTATTVSELGFNCKDVPPVVASVLLETAKTLVFPDVTLVTMFVFAVTSTTLGLLAL